MLNAILEKVKSLFGLETVSRKRRLAGEPDESPDHKIRRTEKPFGVLNYSPTMNPQPSSGTIGSDKRIHHSVLDEHPDVELCWEKKKPGKENQFHWGMIHDETKESEVVDLDDDVQVWREVKPGRRSTSFLENKQNMTRMRQRAHLYSEEGQLSKKDEDVMFLEEASRKDVEDVFPPRLHSCLDPDIPPISDESKRSPTQRRTFFTSRSSISGPPPKFGLLKYNLNIPSLENSKKDTKCVSRLDSASVKNRIRNSNLSRAAILKQSLAPPPHYFGTTPKISPKWARHDPQVKKKPSALDLSSSIDEIKAYNQILQQFTSDKSSVSKMLSAGVEIPAFKIFESQLKRNFTFNQLLKKKANGIEASRKIDMIDLSKSDDDVQELEYLGSDTAASTLQKKQISISKDSQEAAGTSLKAVKVDVQRTREVMPKTSAEATQSVTTLHRPIPNVVDQLIKKSHFTHEEFIDEVVQRYSTEKSKINKEVERETKMKDLWTERRQKFEESLEAKLKKYMKITDVSFDEVLVIEEEEKLPELTTEMLDLVHNALRKNRTCVLARSGSNAITGADIQTLADSNWLNDEVINNYMDMLIQRGQSKEYPSVYAFNTFFYPKLSSNGYASVKRWTKKVDIFQQDMVLVPLHLEVHWALAVIDFRQKTICYYDSMNGRKNIILQLMLKYLQEERMDKKKENFDTSGWQIKLVQDIPQQRNGYDCGVFACMFAEHLARGVVKDSKNSRSLKCSRCYPPFPFSQENMPYFRKRMIYEILTGKLLQ